MVIFKHWKWGIQPAGELEHQKLCALRCLKDQTRRMNSPNIGISRQKLQTRWGKLGFNSENWEFQAAMRILGFFCFKLLSDLVRWSLFGWCGWCLDKVRLAGDKMYCLVLTGTMEFYDFPEKVGNNNPKWRTHIFQNKFEPLQQTWTVDGKIPI